MSRSEDDPSAFHAGIERVSRLDSQFAADFSWKDNLALARDSCLHGKNILPRYLAVFDVPQPGVQQFFNAMQLGAPEIAHIVKTLVNCCEAAVDPAEFCIHVTRSTAHVILPAMRCRRRIARSPEY